MSKNSVDCQPACHLRHEKPPCRHRYKQESTQAGKQAIHESINASTKSSKQASLTGYKIHPAFLLCPHPQLPLPPFSDLAGATMGSWDRWASRLGEGGSLPSTRRGCMPPCRYTRGYATTRDGVETDSTFSRRFALSSLSERKERSIRNSLSEKGYRDIPALRLSLIHI